MTPFLLTCSELKIFTVSFSSLTYNFSELFSFCKTSVFFLFCATHLNILAYCTDMKDMVSFTSDSWSSLVSCLHYIVCKNMLQSHCLLRKLLFSSIGAWYIEKFVTFVTHNTISIIFHLHYTFFAYFNKFFFGHFPIKY